MTADLAPPSAVAFLGLGKMGAPMAGHPSRPAGAFAPSISRRRPSTPSSGRTGALVAPGGQHRDHHIRAGELRQRTRAGAAVLTREALAASRIQIVDRERAATLA